MRLRTDDDIYRARLVYLGPPGYTLPFQLPYAQYGLFVVLVPAFMFVHYLFTLHVDGKVYEVLCTRGDLIAVPDSTQHWFDMGPEPSFVAIRFFTEPDGWVGHFTGTDIAKRFPRYGE